MGWGVATRQQRTQRWHFADWVTIMKPERGMLLAQEGIFGLADGWTSL